MTVPGSTVYRWSTLSLNASNRQNCASTQQNRTGRWLPLLALPVSFGSVVTVNAATTTPATVFVAVALATTQAEPPAAQSELRAFESTYTVIWRGMTAGTSSFDLRHEVGGEWSYRSRNQPRGLFRLVPSAAVTLYSRMSVVGNAVRPLTFTATENDETQPKAQVHFDWEKNRATGTVEGAAIDMRLTSGVQDDLSVQIALIHALALGQVPSGFSVFDKTGIRDYSYTRLGEETLHTPIGDVATVVYRSQRANSSRSTRFWCAPKYGFVPMRAEQQRDTQIEWTMNIRTLRRD